MSDTTSADLTDDPAQIWADYQPTPLLELPALARRADVARVFVKVESERPLGNFKALGGMLAGLRALARIADAASLHDLGPDSRAPLPRLICASDGNHGLAVAAAAARAGTNASIYLPVGVSSARAQRIESLGAEVVWIDGSYDDAVCAAAEAAERGEGLLIADTTSDPHDRIVQDVMEGYALMAHELVAQFREELNVRPSHLFVQAGVGGLAAALADGLMSSMQAPQRVLVVEPKSAACVAHALAVGHPVRIPGELRTSATMLSCGLASAPALQILQRHHARAVLVGEDELLAAPQALREAAGPETTESGASGLAGLLHLAANPALRAEHRLDANSNVLLIVTEGIVDA
jgi:diaminopropionate ammonia-lyase